MTFNLFLQTSARIELQTKYNCYQDITLDNYTDQTGVSRIQIVEAETKYVNFLFMCTMYLLYTIFSFYQYLILRNDIMHKFKENCPQFHKFEFNYVE